MLSKQNHLSFPTNADLPDNLPTRRHTNPHPISENSSVNDWSRGLLLWQSQLSFPTKAVLPDNGRRDNTIPPPPFPKTRRQMAVLAISSYFHFFVFSLKNFWGIFHLRRSESRSAESAFAVRIVDRGPPFEYPCLAWSYVTGDEAKHRLVFFCDDPAGVDDNDELIMYSPFSWFLRG